MECSICKTENIKEIHYCKNCGKNLSKYIEKTDILFFLSHLIKWFGILILIFGYPFVKIMFEIYSIDNPGSYSIKPLLTFVISVIFIILGILLKKYTMNLCKKNII